MNTDAATPAFSVLRVDTAEARAQWERPFAEAYREVFGGEPYREAYSVEKASGVFRMLTNLRGHITLLAVDGRGTVLGFGIAVPLGTQKTLAPRLDGLVPVRHTYYLAELGVRPSARGIGIGRELVRHRIRLMNRDRFSHVVLRVSDMASSSTAMYLALDFEPMGVSMSVTRERTDGQVREDERHFLCRLLSQVDVA